MVAHFPPFRRNLANEYPRRPGSLVTSVGLAMSAPRRCKCLIVKWIEYRRHLALRRYHLLPIFADCGPLLAGFCQLRAVLGDCF